ncbi:hypothetical protein [Hymenobacter sp. DG25B]|uniref:hypothetical protein n=1 Tax=Hymenobacter sp. DG25B TaxID=1385664 RepID=UPI0018CD854E|nr:hypothetical protein [Hymenobacter sp. DG25B]
MPAETLTKSALSSPVISAHRYEQVEALEDLFIGNRLLLERMSLVDIKRHRIKTIQSVEEAPNGKYIVTERFNKQGYATYREMKNQLHNWPESGYSSSFAYTYTPDGAMATISDQTGAKSIAFIYDSQRRLKKAGSYQLDYYPNGLLKKVQGGNHIEQYEYKNGVLTRIQFSFRPGVVACDMGTEEWIGHYNTAGQLVKEEHNGHPTRVYMLTYDQAGILTQKTWHDEFRQINYEKSYTFENGLLVKVILKANGTVTNTTWYLYEQY